MRSSSYQSNTFRLSNGPTVRGLFLASILAFSQLQSSEVSAESSALRREQLRGAFSSVSIQLTDSNIDSIMSSVQTARRDHCQSNAQGSSKVGFAAAEIAHNLGLNPKTDASLSDRIRKAIETLPCDGLPDCELKTGSSGRVGCRPETSLAWDEYFRETVALNDNREFLTLVQQKNFSPVKISWEDISRYQGSVWGDRISDVGIWVRKEESNLDSAELALSVRRDANFRDKVLLVPAEKIKVHRREHGITRELSLPDRLKELGLSSKGRDQHVIVSNQFAVVPVPKRGMLPSGNHPPRAAFNFSIFPYGSTNYVITDVIEGSSEAIVGAGSHQLLYAEVDGKKAPFTASRAEDRQDLLKLESELKKQGMDVDVQRYYLIQIPLRREVSEIKLSNMGSPPMKRFYDSFAGVGGGKTIDDLAVLEAAPAAAPSKVWEHDKSTDLAKSKSEARGFSKVAIGTGESEGDYFGGAGFRGARAEEPMRVTVVYFVTPVGQVTRADMESFSEAFERWDDMSIWGGSFVEKN